MKILFLLSRIEKSGVCIHTLDLAQGLVSEGHDLLMITGGITDPENAYLKEIKANFENLGMEIKYFKTPRGNLFNKAFISLISIIRILVWIKSSKADIIHSQSPYMTFLPWLLRKKYLTTVHNVQLVKNIKYKNPTALIAISKESKEYAVQQLGARRASVSIVCHGVSKRYTEHLSIQEKNDLRNQYNISEDQTVIGFVGRITVEKGLDVLIDAIDNHLPPVLKSKIHLVFLGDFYSDFDEQFLNKAIAASGISERISMVSFQDPLPFYNIFDIFVLPSKVEAFGLVCVEAMLCGSCVIRTNTNGALDQIEHGVDGFIFPNEDAKSLAEIIQKLMENPQLAASISGKGFQKALDNFTIETMTRNTLKVYEKII